MRYLATAERFFEDEPGGAYRVAWELARRFREQGHEVVMLCGAAGSGNAHLSLIGGIEVVRVPLGEGSGDPRQWVTKVLRLRTGLLQIHDRWRWDVIHSHTVIDGLAAELLRRARHRHVHTIHSPAVLERRARGQGPPGVVRRWSDPLKDAFLYLQERMLYRRCDALAALSRYTVAQVARLFGRRLAARVVEMRFWPTLYGNGMARAEARRRLGWNCSLPVIATVRRMVPRMGLSLMLDALEPLAERYAFEAVLVGDGPLRASLAQQAERGALGGRVRFTGRVDEPTLDLIYYAADLVLVPSHSLECFGLVAIEALSRGVPVVAARVGGLPEIVEPVLPGWLFQPDDVTGCRAVIEEILRGERRAPAPEVLRDYVRGAFSREHIGQAYLAWAQA